MLVVVNLLVCGDFTKKDNPRVRIITNKDQASLEASNIIGELISRNGNGKGDTAALRIETISRSRENRTQDRETVEIKFCASLVRIVPTTSTDDETEEQQQ